MEALIIIAASLLVGLIFLLASERQIAASRKIRDLDPAEKAPPAGYRRFPDDDYEDIFYPRKKKARRLRRAPEGGFDDPYFYDYEDFSRYEKDLPKEHSEREKKSGNVVGAYVNFMAVLLVTYMLLKYFSFI